MVRVATASGDCRNFAGMGGQRSRLHERRQHLGAVADVAMVWQPATCRTANSHWRCWMPPRFQCCDSALPSRTRSPAFCQLLVAGRPWPYVTHQTTRVLRPFTLLCCSYCPPGSFAKVAISNEHRETPTQLVKNGNDQIRHRSGSSSLAPSDPAARRHAASAEREHAAAAGALERKLAARARPCATVHTCLI